MALVKETLGAAIFAAMQKQFANSSADPKVAQKQFADDLASAIDTYIKTATVTTPPGVAVQVAPISGTGATTAPGIGTIS